ncbi:hypothetical protein EGW08_022900, partial [Elysia chlorotica]
APRSPSWREGLESPPFSPRRRDSYPGKRRGSHSPMEKKGGGSHFSYSDISPPSRQLSLDELYGGQAASSALDNGPQVYHQQQYQYQQQQQQHGHYSRQGGDGDIDSFDNSRASSSNESVVVCGVPHSAPVMDLATFAANITSSTNTLTSLTAGSVSPRTQQNASPSMLSGSPEDSEDSSCSSPVSPGYYDNATPPSDEPEEVCELADPASKSIDMQGSKRQKARPPSTDWSPVIDLSPILDVSPSVEEAEQEDMLAKRMEELERQRSREAGEDEDEEEEGEEVEKCLQHQGQGQSMLPSKFRGKAGPLVTPLNLTNTNLSSNSSSMSSDRDIEMLDIADQIQRITQDMENIVKKGEVVDVRPVPPPKPKRRLPDAEVGQSPPSNLTIEKRELSASKNEERKHCSATKETSVKVSSSKGNALKGPEFKTTGVIGKKQADMYSQSMMSVPSIVMDSAADLGPHKDDASHIVPRQDSGDRKKAKDLKAKPSPLLITHIECEEQSVSPHYRVMESPPTPETKTVKREFSDSTSVSPSSTPDQDVYAFPSPVTPPDSDSSPPKPHSPSSPGTDFDEE